MNFPPTPPGSLEGRISAAGERARSAARAGQDRMVAGVLARLDAQESARARGGLMAWWGAFLARPRLAMAVACCLLLVAGGALTLSLRTRNVGTLLYAEGVMLAGRRTSASEVIASQTMLRAPQGSHALCGLDNGRAQLYLASDSTLTIQSGRRVELASGSAWFSILPNSGQFLVSTPHGVVEVTGTSFGVRVGDGTADVFLATGRVTFHHGVGESLAMAPEDHLRTSPAGPTVTPGTPPAWAVTLYRDFERAYAAAFFPSLAGPSPSAPTR